MEHQSLFADHVRHVCQVYEKALTALAKEAHAIEGVLVHSGSEGIYYSDDIHIPFRSFGHFNYWLPVPRPDQMVLFVPGKKPTYFQVVPPDFWYEQTVNRESWWADSFDVIELDAPEKVFDYLPANRRLAFLGEATNFASNLGLPVFLHNERNLLNYLDYHRGMKTPYEIACLSEANRLGVQSHHAAHQAFLARGSEWDIHHAFLGASEMVEFDSPYTNIVALDEKAAILHYQNKRRLSGADSKVLLIDAGCRAHGYCSDITRTYARDDAHPIFRDLIKGVDKLQLDLVDQAKIGTAYVDLQHGAHAGILDLLLGHDLIRGSREELETEKITSVFFPHGIGHLLGLQVHDVGGFLSDDAGALAPAPEDHKFLRLNRKMAKDMVFTIEPGLYFIPALLEPKRDSEHHGLFNWPLIDAITPCGGIRIEDNIVVTETGAQNLTR